MQEKKLSKLLNKDEIFALRSVRSTVDSQTIRLLSDTPEWQKVSINNDITMRNARKNNRQFQEDFLNAREQQNDLAGAVAKKGMRETAAEIKAIRIERGKLLADQKLRQDTATKRLGSYVHMYQQEHIELLLNGNTEAAKAMMTASKGTTGKNIFGRKDKRQIERELKMIESTTAVVNDYAPKIMIPDLLFSKAKTISYPRVGRFSSAGKVKPLTPVQSEISAIMGKIRLDKKELLGQREVLNQIDDMIQIEGLNLSESVTKLSDIVYSEFSKLKTKQHYPYNDIKSVINHTVEQNQRAKITKVDRLIDDTTFVKPKDITPEYNQVIKTIKDREINIADLALDVEHKVARGSGREKAIRSVARSLRKVIDSNSGPKGVPVSYKTAEKTVRRSLDKAKDVRAVRRFTGEDGASGNAAILMKETPERVGRVSGKLQDAGYQSGLFDHYGLDSRITGPHTQFLQNRSLLWRSFLDDISGMPEVMSKELKRDWIPLDGKKWGRFEGYHMNPLQFDDLNGMSSVVAHEYMKTGTGEFLGTQWGVAKSTLELYYRGLRLWKKGKLFVNPGTYSRNFMTNLWWMDTSYGKGVGSKAGRDVMRNAVKTFHNGNPIYELGIREGVHRGDFIANDMNALTKALNNSKTDIQFAGDYFKSLNKTFESESTLVRFMNKTWNGEYYSNVDGIFRHAIFQDQLNILMRNGDYTLSEAAPIAASKARYHMLDYAKMSKAAVAMRNTGLPFFAFTFKAVPHLFSLAYRNPLKVAKWSAYYWAMDEAMGSMAGYTDEQKGYLEEMSNMDQGGLLPWVPDDGMIVPGGNKDKGDYMTWDTRNMFYFNNLLRNSGVSGKGFLQSFDVFTQNPLWGPFVQVYLNKHAFLDKPIYNNDDSGSTKIAKSIAFVWRQWMPNLAPGIGDVVDALPDIGKDVDGNTDIVGKHLESHFDNPNLKGGWGFDKIKGTLKNEKAFDDPEAYRLGLGMLLMDQMFGIKVGMHNRNTQRKYKSLDYAKAFKSQMIDIRKQYDMRRENAGSDPEKKRQAVERYKADKKRIKEQLQDEYSILYRRWIK